MLSGRGSKMLHYQIPGSVLTCTAIYSSKEPLRLWVIPQLNGSTCYMWSLHMYSWPRDMLLCWIDLYWLETCVCIREETTFTSEEISR